mgnify:CR=1 FL=1|tara:strand:+ start:90 stop:368 length:279 start_codon:yes stop_codon:yes gene_type:complete
MIQKFKKWLTVGTVRSKYNLFKIVVIGEVILIIALVCLICQNVSLKKDIKSLEEINLKNLDIINTIHDPISEDSINDRGVILDENYIPQSQR